MRQRAVRRWLFGAVAAMVIWMASTVPLFLVAEPNGWSSGAVLANIAVFMLAFVLVPPLSWGKTLPVRLGWLGLLFALSLPFLMYPEYASSAPWMWIFVAVAGSMQANGRRITSATLLALALLAVVLELRAGVRWPEALIQPVMIISIGAMVGAFSRQNEAIRELRQTQHELAELAVREERNRVARDMHDILGHSLTVIAVKAELAGRLLPIDPGRAAAEIADLEDLARGALEDVRATVGGYRGVSILSELASARTALAAAGIEAELPGAADAVPAKYRELFGWALREGVTNVIRHAGASRCRVGMGARFLQIDDDGVGPCAPGTGHGGPHPDSAAKISADNDSAARPPGNGLRGSASVPRRRGQPWCWADRNWAASCSGSACDPVGDCRRPVPGPWRPRRAAGLGRRH